MPCGFRQAALSISLLSPIFKRPDTFLARKIASLIFRPDRRFLAFFLPELRRPTLSLGQLFSNLGTKTLSLAFANPPAAPGNIRSLSRRRLTRSTRPFLAATNLDDWPSAGL